jgi:hypothetical protein
LPGGDGYSLPCQCVGVSVYAWRRWTVSSLSVCQCVCVCLLATDGLFFVSVSVSVYAWRRRMVSSLSVCQCVCVCLAATGGLFRVSVSVCLCKTAGDEWSLLCQCVSLSVYAWRRRMVPSVSVYLCVCESPVRLRLRLITTDSLSHTSALTDLVSMRQEDPLRRLMCPAWWRERMRKRKEPACT